MEFLEAEPKETTRQKILNIALDVLIVLMFVAVGFFFYVTPILVSGNSMDATLKDDDIVATTRYVSGKLNRGAIVVAQAPIDGDQVTVIKRIVAVGGDRIAFVEEGDAVFLYRKTGEEWVKQNEPYLKERMDRTMFPSVSEIPIYSSVSEISASLEIKKGHLFLMGDNRNVSLDSRRIGQIPVQDVTGVMLFNISETPVINFIYQMLYPFSKGESYD